MSRLRWRSSHRDPLKRWNPESVRWHFFNRDRWSQWKRELQALYFNINTSLVDWAASPENRHDCIMFTPSSPGNTEPCWHLLHTPSHPHWKYEGHEENVRLWHSTNIWAFNSERSDPKERWICALVSMNLTFCFLVWRRFYCLDVFHSVLLRYGCYFLP